MHKCANNPSMHSQHSSGDLFNGTQWGTDLKQAPYPSNSKSTAVYDL